MSLSKTVVQPWYYKGLVVQGECGAFWTVGS